MPFDRTSHRVSSRPPTSPEAEVHSLAALLAAFELSTAGENDSFPESTFSCRSSPPADVRALVATGLLCEHRAGKSDGILTLTRKGEQVCRAVVRAYRKSINAQPRPEWNAATRTLTFDDTVVKRFKRAAPNQEWVLSQFQRREWPERLTDCLSDDCGVADPERLRETIKSLNSRLVKPLIRFRADGTGRGVCWGPS